MSDGPVQMYRSLPTYGPTGEKTLIQLSPDVKTAKQLREKAVKDVTLDSRTDSGQCLSDLRWKDPGRLHPAV
ncbi:hypothetical protein Q5P01_002579 [Channa striata]|uniref:Uncharacterized protein n=1 Tax=Channa striata TaxID=64152 RepID=A0AA88NMS5_CHASR|nr:hypothetical protein Q5P01_002579 [Channa striata]